MGTVWRNSTSSEFSFWRNGKSACHLRDSTILAGDRSLTTLIAHELRAFLEWQPGDQRYVERLLDEWRLHSVFRKSYHGSFVWKRYLWHAKSSWLWRPEETVAELGDTSADTHLKLKLDGRDPDDGMNDIAYERTFSFVADGTNCRQRKIWSLPQQPFPQSCISYHHNWTVHWRIQKRSDSKRQYACREDWYRQMDLWSGHSRELSADSFRAVWSGSEKCGRLEKRHTG